MEPTRRLDPLRVPSFARLLSSYTLNELGDSIGLVALAVLVYDGTDAVIPTAAFFLAARFIPALIAPALTARMDRIAPARALPLLYVFEAAAFGLLAWLASLHSLPLAPVLALGLIDGSLAITARGLTRGAIAGALQPRGMLADGNALVNLGFAVSAALGSALGGVLVGELGATWALTINALSFLAIALLLVGARSLPAPQSDRREPWRERLRDGIGFARTSARVRVLLLGQSLALICFTLVVPIEVIYAMRSLGTTSTGFGALLAAWGGGLLLGSLLFLSIGRRAGLGLVLVSSAAVGLAYLGLAGAQTLLLACLISIVGGAGNGIQWVAVMTALQKSTPPTYQARVAGLMESLGAAMPGVGFLVGAAIVALSSPRAAYAVAGGGVLVLVALATSQRRAYERGAHYEPSSDLDDDRQDHRAALQARVDERRQVIVQD